jgi:hypothetical protein
VVSQGTFREKVFNLFSIDQKLWLTPSASGDFGFLGAFDAAVAHSAGRVFQVKRCACVHWLAVTPFSKIPKFAGWV